ncbi:MAG TPA: FAD-binding protein [Terracidiphilus sp.]|jgi:alditol oxidase|nr:FAD-binding protein [Terracidiphilus sp.]
MDKREFLKASGALVAASMLPRVAAGQEITGPRQNWAGNITFSTDRLYHPASVDEVRQVVKSCQKLRALGSRHSFNRIADSKYNQISLTKLDEITLDEKARTVTVGAGVKYGQMAPVIDAKGYAVHNLASLPHISVAGAIATATHGSGVHNGNLATAVSGLEIVTANGEVLHLSRANDGERFKAAVVGLGSLGMVTRVTLDVQPTYQVAQSVYQNLSLSHLKTHLEEIFSSGYSVSLFTLWQNHEATQVWIKRRLAPGDKNQWAPEFFGAKLATKKLHPLAGHDPVSCTEQEGIPGPWYERLPHFRMNFTPSSGQELQTEYLIPRSHGYEAILAVEKLRDAITPHLFITELRTIAADDLWMSTAYKRDSMALHFTWKPEWPAVSRVLPQIEKALEPFDARPHWGKLFTMAPAEIESRYVKLAEFEGMLKQHDPAGKFRNEFISKNLYAS